MTNETTGPIRLCAGPDCDADISHKRRGTLFCSRSCRDKAAYADSERHKAAEERRDERPPAKLPSLIRQEKRRWAKEKKEIHEQQKVNLDDPLGFKAYRERDPSADDGDEVIQIMRDQSLTIEERNARIAQLWEQRDARLKDLEMELFGRVITDEEEAAWEYQAEKEEKKQTVDTLTFEDDDLCAACQAEQEAAAAD
jgi:hypothetical protein